MKVTLQDDNSQKFGHAHCFVNSPDDEEGHACTELKRQLDVQEVLGRNLLAPNATEANYRVELNIDNPTTEEIKVLKVEIYEKDSTGKVTLKEAELKEDLTLTHTHTKQEDNVNLVEVRAKVYPTAYPENSGEGVSYMRVMVGEEVSDVSINTKREAYSKDAQTDEELTVYAKTNAPEGEALPIKLEIFMKGSAETKIVELEEYVESTEINRTLTFDEIAQLGSVDANDIKEVQASVVYKDKEYKSNKTKAKRTLVAEVWADNGILNDIVEGKKKESYKKEAKGEEVKLIQTAMQKMKIDIGEDGIDGVFGNDGHDAVKTFQANYKPTHSTHKYEWSEPDGVVGKNTLLAMDEALVEGWKYEKSKVIWDKATIQKITSLHPKIRDNAEKFILDAQNQKIYLKITSAYRSIEEQNDLYLKGRILKGGQYSKTGKTVTNAKGGESYHNFGLAIDIVEIKNKKALWDNDWEKLGKIGKKHGFDWGGEWTKFKDKPHFQMTFGNSTKTLLKKVENQEMENGYVKL